MTLITAFLFGVIFGLGLGISGMTQPARIIGFLNVAGRWDPTLLFVMGAALATSFVLFPAILKRSAPILAERFDLPERRSIDTPLIAGATLFGIGWGLSGYCPGPALVSIVTGATPVVVFIAFMAFGFAIGNRMAR